MAFRAMMQLQLLSRKYPPRLLHAVSTPTSPRAFHAQLLLETYADNALEFHEHMFVWTAHIFN